MGRIATAAVAALVGAALVTACTDPGDPTFAGSSDGPAGTTTTSNATSTGDDGGSTATEGDETTTMQGSTGGAGQCEGPSADEPAWLAAYQQDIVSRLSGELPLPDGGTLPERSSAQNRSLTRAYLHGLWDELGIDNFSHDYAPDGANVYATVDATIDTDETIVLGAHFDSVPGSPGANDNATGVALVFAVARVVAALPCRERNVVFVLFDQEEIGLVGSRAFAQFLTGLALDVHSVHTVDQMGWDADGDRAVEIERPDAGLLELYAALVRAVGLPIPLQPTQTGSTDHVAFRELGFEAVGITEEFVSGDTTPHYHLPGDTFATVDLAYLRSTTVMVSLAFAELVLP